METPLLSYVSWLELPQPTRNKLAALFKIPKSGESVVHIGTMAGGNIAGVQKQDGYTPHDLAAITVERMQDLLDSKDTDFHKLFGKVVANIDELSGIVPEEVAPIAAVKAVEPTAKASEEFVPRDPIELIKPKTGKNAKTKKAAA